MQIVDADLLITGRDERPIEDGRLLVADGRVSEVGPREDVDAPDGADSVAHEVVVPGLIDAHIHLMGAREMHPMSWLTLSTELGTARATADLRSLLAAGFTAVRDVGSGSGIGLRDAVEEGEIPGPRVFTSGPSISQTAGHGDAHYLPHDWVTDEANGMGGIADGEDECRKEARKRIRDGVDLLKVMTTGGVLSEKDAPDQSQFTDDEVAAMVEEAHRVDVPVASHAQGAEGIKTALRNGVDTIEHGFYLDEECLDLFLETDATFVPTLAIMHRLIEEGDEHGVPEYGLRKAREAQEAHFEAVERAHEAGVPIAVGTDFVGPDLVPHGENALELELLAEDVGMDEHDVLQSATRVAARTVPADDVGTLEPGNHADFLALGANPLDDISAVRDPETVYKGGDPVRL